MREVLDKSYKFKVISNTRLGRACVAIKKILKGEIICKMAGPNISLKEFSEKYDINGCTPLQIGEDIFIDLIEPYVCFNHSCDPNAGLRNNAVLFALKDIKVGEEIFYDYSTSVDDVWWTMECKCRTKKCRKLIGDFQSVPHLQKEFYRKNKALTKYIHTIYY